MNATIKKRVKDCPFVKALEKEVSELKGDMDNMKQIKIEVDDNLTPAVKSLEKKVDKNNTSSLEQLFQT